MSGTGPRAGLCEGFLGSSSGAPGPRELSSACEGCKLDMTDIGWRGPYPSTESPYTSNEPTALMTSSVRCVSSLQWASRSRTGICSEHIGHWRVSARLTTPRVEISKTIVKEMGYEHTFLYCDRRRSGGIGVMRGVISDFFKPVRRSLLPFIPGVEEKSQVQRSIGVLSECRYQLC